MSSLARSLYLDTNVYIAAAGTGALHRPSDLAISVIRSRRLGVAGSVTLRQELGPRRHRDSGPDPLDLYLALIAFEFPASREVRELRDRFMAAARLRTVDAEHLAYAVYCGVDVFLSWNRRDLVRPATVDRVTVVDERLGLRTPRILDPSDFLRKARATSRYGRVVLE